MQKSVVATPRGSTVNAIVGPGEGCLTFTKGGYGFRLIASGQRLKKHELPPLQAKPGEVVVAVAGCGVCHTDIGFAYDGVPTRASCRAGQPTICRRQFMPGTMVTEALLL